MRLDRTSWFFYHILLKNHDVIQHEAEAALASIRIHLHTDLGALPPSCRQLFDAASSQGLFFSLPWFANLLANGMSPGTLFRLYVAELPAGLPHSASHAGSGSGEVWDSATATPDTSVVAGVGNADTAPSPSSAASLALPLTVLTQERAWPARHAMAACANYYSSLTGPLAAPGTMENIARLAALNDALVKAIAAEPQRWDTLSLAPVDLANPAVAALRAALRRHGFAVQVHRTFVNRYLPLAGQDHAQYLAGLPSTLRNTVQRKTRQLEKTGRARIDILTRSDQVDEAIAAWSAVYGASWKQPEPHPLFMPGLIRLCAQQGWLRLGVVYLDDQPIAAQVWIVAHGVASIYKLAYDEQYSRWSAGTVLTARLMQHVIEVDRVREVDYLTGDDAYKRDWMPLSRQRHGLLAFNLRTWRGRLGAFRHLGAAWVRQKFAGLADSRKQADQSV